MKNIKCEIINSIPILNSLQFEILSLSLNHCEIKLPLAPHRNHKQSAFGGSIYNASIACCYSLLFYIKNSYDCKNKELVIAKANIAYLKPVTEDFIASTFLDAIQLNNLVDSFTIPKSKRIILQSEIKYSKDSNSLARFEGEFAFIPNTN